MACDCGREIHYVCELHNGSKSATEWNRIETEVGLPTGDSRSSESWWVISSTELLAALRRVHDGDDPDIAYAELYANSQSQETEGE